MILDFQRNIPTRLLHFWLLHFWNLGRYFDIWGKFYRLQCTYFSAFKGVRRKGDLARANIVIWAAAVFRNLKAAISSEALLLLLSILVDTLG